MQTERTYRTFTTFDPGQRKFVVVAGWDRREESYYLVIYRAKTNEEIESVFSSRIQCENPPTFADLTYILRDHALHYPDDWAFALLCDRDETRPTPEKDHEDYGTYHATKPPKES